MNRTLIAAGLGVLVLAAGCTASAVTGVASAPATTSTTSTKTTSTTSSAPAAGPASVVVAKGDSAEGKPGCSVPQCAFVVATTSGFAGTVTCTVGSPESWGSSWTQGASERKQSPNYFGFPGKAVTVTCVGGGQSASGSLTW